MLDFSDENGVETIRLLGEILEELRKLNESIDDMREFKGINGDEEPRRGNFNDIIKAIYDTEYFG